MRFVDTPLIKPKLMMGANGELTQTIDPIAEHQVKAMANATADAKQRNQKIGRKIGAANGDVYVPGLLGVLWTREVLNGFPYSVGLAYFSNSNGGSINLPDVKKDSNAMLDYCHDNVPGYYRCSMQPSTTLTTIAPPSGGGGGCHAYIGTPYVPPSGSPYGNGSYNPASGTWVPPTNNTIGTPEISSITQTYNATTGSYVDTISWGAVTSAVKYSLFAGAAQNTYQTQTFVTGGGTSFTTTIPIPPGQTSHYRVAAHAADGTYGSASNTEGTQAAPALPALTVTGVTTSGTGPWNDAVTFTNTSDSRVTSYLITAYFQGFVANSVGQPLSSTTATLSVSQIGTYNYVAQCVNAGGFYGPLGTSFVVHHP